MAGYSGTPLAKKIGYKDNFRVSIINEPRNFKNNLLPVPKNVEFMIYDPKILDLNIIHIFTKSRDELERLLDQTKSQIKKSGMIWISWPKKASKVVTDLDGNVVREIGLETGLVDIKVAAIDEIWSGLKFVYRKEDR